MNTTRMIHFIREHTGEAFRGYTEEALVDYIVFHATRRQLAAAFTKDIKECVGVLVGWRISKPEAPEFRWQEADPEGGWWFWHAFAASTPTAGLACAAWHFTNNPVCFRLPAVALRRGQLKLYRPGECLDIYRRGEMYGSKHQHATS